MSVTIEELESDIQNLKDRFSILESLVNELIEKVDPAEISRELGRQIEDRFVDQGMSGR